MSQDDDSFRAETVQAGCKDRGIGTDETGDVRGVKLDDGSDTGTNLVLSAYGIIIFPQSTERARFFIRDACAAQQTHLTYYHLKLGERR